MKRFTVSKEIFDRLPDYCLGVVAVDSFDNSESMFVRELLDKNVKDFCVCHGQDPVREIEGIKKCREAFHALGMNPNKFMPSIESLAKRVQKTGELPHINPLVDLGNTLSLKYCLPMGAHDIDKLEPEGMSVRLSRAGDRFQPMGESECEQMPEGEPVYVSGSTVKTRRWIWRQSDDGKITQTTSHVFFPIDGFDKDAVLAARDELADIFEKVFSLKVIKGFVDKHSPSVQIE
jgi:DNA/RNA-binding domain of Phe-tRNA-synthetase-like protein